MLVGSCFAALLALSLLSFAEPAQAQDGASCTCTCCMSCAQAVDVGSFGASAVGQCTADACAEAYPDQCPSYQAGSWGTNWPSYNEVSIAAASGDASTATMKLVNQSSTCAANGYHLCFAGPYSIKITGSLARLNSTTNLTHDCPIATLTTYTSGDGLANVKAHGSFPSGTLINATKASSNTIRINTFDGDKAHNCTAYYQITDGTYLEATVGTTASSSTVTSSNGCFSGDASAVTETSAGSVISKSMRDLAIGDRVLVSQQSGKTGFEEIFMFTHRSSEQAASISMMTASGSSLQVTPDHYMLAQKAKSLSSSSPSIIAASAIKVGDRLWTTPKNAANGELTWSTVTSVRQTTQQGLYNPHTPSGTIVVDGVAACTFPDRLPASFAAHAWATLPARVLHRMLMTNKLRTIVNDALLAGYFHLQNAYNSVLVSSMARAAAQAVRAS